MSRRWPSGRSSATRTERCRPRSRSARISSARAGRGRAGYLQRAVDLLRPTGATSLRSVALNNLGEVYLGLGDLDAAAECYRRGARHLPGDRRLRRRSRAAQSRARLPGPAPARRRDRQCFRKPSPGIGHRGDLVGEAMALMNLGTAQPRPVARPGREPSLADGTGDLRADRGPGTRRRRPPRCSRRLPAGKAAVQAPGPIRLARLRIICDIARLAGDALLNSLTCGDAQEFPSDQGMTRGPGTALPGQDEGREEKMSELQPRSSGRSRVGRPGRSRESTISALSTIRRSRRSSRTAGPLSRRPVLRPRSRPSRTASRLALPDQAMCVRMNRTARTS